MRTLSKIATYKAPIWVWLAASPTTFIHLFFPEKLLKARPQASHSLSTPFTFNIRGGFWGIEVDSDGPEAMTLDFKRQQFAMLVQVDGLVIMGMTGGANLQGTKGDVILSSAYNVTVQEVEKMFGDSVDAALKAHQV
jgi:hypothetical protein